ncbi:MAG: response regulator [Turneriella sp.]
MWLIDVRLPRMPGTELVARLRTQHQRETVLLYSREDPHVITEAIIAGANGYIIKDTAPDLLLLELETVARGGTTLTPAGAENFQRLATTTGKTRRWRQQNSGSRENGERLYLYADRR